ncbi:MAG: hypothetical protein E7647_03185 [Ruminococcaceae bacterium]|nr:hypothetical protein [Oscillospiraceae bacterium]
MKRIIASLLIAVLLAALLFSLTFSVSASGPATESVSLDIFNKEYWSGGDGVADISVKKASGNPLLTVSAKADAALVSFSCGFDPMDLSKYTELAVNLAVRGEGENYDITVTLFAGDTSSSFTETVTSEDAVLYVPLEESVSLSLSGISVSARSDSLPISYINLISVKADNTYTYSYIKTFSSTDVYSEGSLKRSPDSVTVTPKGGEADLYFDFIDTATDTQSLLVWFTLADAYTGSVCCETLDKDGNLYTSPQQIISRKGTYTFSLTGGFRELALRFSSLSESTSGVTVTAAGIYTVGSIERSFGTVTSCRYDGKRISVSGSLSSDATSGYYGSRILLYAIPASEAGSCDLEEYEPVASSGFSTKFRINCELDRSYTEYFYKTVLDTKDGLLPIGSICAPSGGMTSPSTTNAVSALYGADAADVFETNVSSVIMDISAGKLLESDDIYSAQIYNYQKKTYYFDKDYLSDLDDRMRFYTAAGVNVYLRFYSDRDGYAFDYSADNSESLSLMCAVSGFISERYPQVNGYIVGVAANDHITSLTAEYAEARARLVAVFSESIRSKNPAAQIILPYSESAPADPFLSCSLISHYLSKYKAGATVCMYEAAKNAQDSYAVASQLASVCAQMGAQSGGGAVLWNVPSTLSAKEITDSYRNLCINSAAQGLSFAALSVTRTDKDSSLYDQLKVMLDMENLISASISQIAPMESEPAFSGSFALWDFTSSYDTASWVSGGSFSPPITAKGDGGNRVMMAKSSGLAEGAGILICRTEASLNMSDVCARVSFSVASETAKAADVTVIFGSGESRAEFSATVECNKPTSVICDMKEFPGGANVDYAALIIRGDAECTASLSKIEICSPRLDSSELEARYAPDIPEEHNPLLYAIIIFVAAGTVMVFSVLWKNQSSRKKDNTP